MDKSPDAFRTISEVAGDLDLPQHVLRFWETRFVQIKPLKRGGGRRYYRPDDVDLLKGIRHLLYGEGYTIRGVQRILKEQGVRFVMEVWREGAPQPPTAGRFDGEPRHTPAEDWADDWAAGAEEPAPDEAPRWSAHDADPLVPPAAVLDALDDPADAIAPAPHVEPTFAARRPDPAPAAFVPDDAPERPPEPRPEPRLDDDRARALAQRFAPRATPLAPVEPRPAPPVAPPRLLPRQAIAPRPLAGEPRSVPALETHRPAFGQFLDRLRSAPPPTATAPQVDDGGPGPATALSRDDVRRLQATLFELLECKRLLDQIR